MKEHTTRAMAGLVTIALVSWPLAVFSSTKSLLLALGGGGLGENFALFALGRLGFFHFALVRARRGSRHLIGQQNKIRNRRI